MVKRQLRDSIRRKKKYTTRIGLCQRNRDTEVGVGDEEKEEIPGGRHCPY